MRRSSRNTGSRRAPWPFIVLLLLILVSCSSVCWYTNSRSCQAADKAFDKLIARSTVEQSFFKELNNYAILSDKRIKDYIQEDYNLVAEDSTAMNKTLDKIAALEERRREEDGIKAAEFKASTRWFFGWSARHSAVVDITKTLQSVDKTEADCLKVRGPLNKLLKGMNALYIRHANDEINGDEFSEQKRAIDAQINPLQTKYLTLSRRLENEKGDIFGKVGVIGE